uniref:DNA-directed RNA polymerase M/15kDa subunit domain-containing protein n=1 Tax=viral metagenome TaxID=1070528 RepID=A0A6C0B6U1_9ZZZZ
MKFCDKCDNMYYIGISADDPNQLTYYCRFCGNKDKTITEEGVCVLNTQFKKTEQKFNHIINAYTKVDPTLPRIYNVKCPNVECKTNHEEHKNPAEVIYIRYDDDNLKYLYICVECDTTWKSGDA